MSRQQQDAPPNMVEDWIKTLHVLQFVVHSGAWPSKILLVKPGCIGRRAYGLDCLAGLMFAYPCFGQWVTDPTDGRLFMRLWAVLWWLLVIHVVASQLLNRKWRIHSRDIGSRYWLPGGNWTIAAVSIASYLFIRPAMNGLGTFLAYSPALLVASNLIVEFRMSIPIAGVGDAEIEAEDFQRRLG